MIFIAISYKSTHPRSGYIVLEASALHQQRVITYLSQKKQATFFLRESIYNTFMRQEMRREQIRIEPIA
jgi:hypothetical protein